MKDDVTSENAIQVADRVINQAQLDAELLERHCLVPTRAYIVDKERAKASTKNAQRQARYTERKAAQGMVKEWVPREVIEGLKAHGGDYRAWVATLAANPAVSPEGATGSRPPPKPIHIRIDAPALLSDDDLLSLEAGRKLVHLPKFKKWLISLLLR